MLRVFTPSGLRQAEPPHPRNHLKPRFAPHAFAHLLQHIYREPPIVRRPLIFVVVFLLLAGLIGGWSYVQFVFKPVLIKGFIAKAMPPPATVAVAVAKVETWAPRVTAIGSFRAVKGVDLAPQVGGVITAILVDSGEDVAHGAPLFNIDTSVEEADLQNNLATLKNAQLTLDRQRQLTQSGNTTKANVDAAEAARDTAAASAARVRALIAQKKIVAPFAGRLGIRRVDIGQYVAPGTILTTLQALNPIFVDFPVPEQSLAEIKTGQTVEVTVDTFPNRVFTGKVQTIDAKVDQNTRNLYPHLLADQPPDPVPCRDLDHQRSHGPGRQRQQPLCL